MQRYTQTVQQLARQMLTDGRVDKSFGFARGTLPMASVPFCARTPEETEKLVVDSFCGMNLANYLTDSGETIGVIAKGCETRSIVNHIVENKISRDQVVIIGVPCLGLIDKRKVSAAYGGDITEAREAEGRLIVNGSAGEKKFEKSAVMDDCCAVCVHRNPVIYDELAGEQVEEQTDVDSYAMIAEVENLPEEERWQYFEDLFSDCIR